MFSKSERQHCVFCFYFSGINKLPYSHIILFCSVKLKKKKSIFTIFKSLIGNLCAVCAWVTTAEGAVALH